MPLTSSKVSEKSKSFQALIHRLQGFWADQGCLLLQPYDIEVGAGTFHPATTLHSLGHPDDVWNCAYVQPSRRPTDGRYGDNPNRLQHFYQYQVLLKPSPENVQELYLESLQELGIDSALHDIRPSTPFSFFRVSQGSSGKFSGVQLAFLV